MGLLEILFDILHYSFIAKFFNLENLEEIPSNLFKILQLCCRLIKFTIAEYRPNEIYATQWLNLLLELSIKTSKS